MKLYLFCVSVEGECGGGLKQGKGRIDIVAVNCPNTIQGILSLLLWAR